MLFKFTVDKPFGFYLLEKEDIDNVNEILKNDKYNRHNVIITKIEDYNACRFSVDFSISNENYHNDRCGYQELMQELCDIIFRSVSSHVRPHIFIKMEHVSLMRFKITYVLNESFDIYINLEYLYKENSKIEDMFEGDVLFDSLKKEKYYNSLIKESVIRLSDEIKNYSHIYKTLREHENFESIHKIVKEFLETK